MTEFNGTAFHGMRVIESVYLTEDGEPYKVRRTWRERLFTRPWRPWLNFTVVTPRVPYKGAIQLDANTIVMHPETLRRLKAALPDCDCRNPRCGHKASKHVGVSGACIEVGCTCGPGGWT